jgi:hypothetical protein
VYVGGAACDSSDAAAIATTEDISSPTEAKHSDPLGIHFPPTSAAEAGSSASSIEDLPGAASVLAASAGATVTANYTSENASTTESDTANATVMASETSEIVSASESESKTTAFVGQVANEPDLLLRLFGAGGLVDGLGDGLGDEAAKDANGPGPS